ADWVFLKGKEAVYPEPQGKQSKKMLTGEQARKALFKMVLSLRRNKLLQDELKVLKSQPIKNVHKTIIRIGRWYCDLRQLSFSIGFDDLPFILEYSGVFFLNKSGEWEAKLTGMIQS